MNGDLSDPTLYADGDPHAVWAWLRDNSPVAWCQSGDDGLWAITKYADVVAISQSPRTFSANTRGRPDAELTLEKTDPPEHTRLRRLLGPTFAPRATAARAKRVRAFARRAVAAAVERGACDWAELAGGVSALALCDLVGAPQGDAPGVLALTARVQDDAPDPLDPPTARRELVAYVRPLVEEHLRTGTGLVGELRRGTQDVVSVREGVALYLVLINAGQQTVANTASVGLLALLEHPTERERLLASPSRLMRAVEEMMRWASPIISFDRRALVDVVIRGREIRAGETVRLYFPSANRDQDAFADPFRFDVFRDANRHLAFGSGHHFCLGASLARLELWALFEELLPYLSGVRRAGDIRRRRSTLNFGLESLPVRFGA